MADDNNGNADRGEKEKPERSRWWDYYYVRYFVGSVFAVPLMLSLSKTAAVEELIGPIDKSKILDATVIGAAGLAFCYIASAPILLLHATRTNIAKFHWKPRRPWEFLPIFTVGVIVLGLLGVSIWIYNTTSKPTEAETWLSFIPMLLIVATQVVQIWCATPQRIAEFYRQLSKDRAADPQGLTGRFRKEYIESYRDMREHGNALMILVMEGVLTAALLHATSKGVLLAMLILWIAPAAFVWFIATRLEGELHQVK